MSHSLEIEIGDLEYELEVTHVDFGKEPQGWDPGAGAEIEFGDVVKVWGLVEKEVAPGSFNAVPGVIERISFDEFLVIYAEFHDIKKMSESGTRGAATAHLDEWALEELEHQLKGEYDDSDV